MTDESAPPPNNGEGSGDDDNVVPIRRGQAPPSEAPPIDLKAPASEPLTLARQERNDIGNAKRFAARAVDRLVYVDRWGWARWDGKVWNVEDGEHGAAEHALATVAAMWGEAAALEARAATLKAAGKESDSKKAKADANLLRKHASDCGMAGRLESMARVARSMLRARAAEFDESRDLLNVQNGTLSPRTIQGDLLDANMSPHDPRARITKIAAVAYDEKATAPEWERHLELVLPDPADRDFLQTAIGYSLTGHTREQCIFMLHGKGGDGKSTTMNVIRRVLGSYAQAADVKTFLSGGNQRSGDDASPSLARLAGDVRLVSCGEPTRGATLNEGLIKQVTGGSPVLARELNKAPFEYVPRFKVWVEFNPRPRIPGDDDGIWRRIKVLPFPTQIAKSQAVDKAYEERLMAEAPGILNWALDGLNNYLRNGLVDSPNVRAATEDYRRGSNPFGDWWADRVIEDDSVKVKASELYADYSEWCERHGVEAMKQQAFGRALGDRQIIRAGKDRKGNVLRRGAKLREPGDDGGILAAQAFAPADDAADSDGGEA